MEKSSLVLLAKAKCFRFSVTEPLGSVHTYGESHRFSHHLKMDSIHSYGAFYT